jgi:hypothetical protein
LELKRVLIDQQTITTKKLSRLLQSMNISLKDKPEIDPQVAYLKGEIAKLKKQLKRG